MAKRPGTLKLDRSALKRYTFDAIFFTYSVALIAYVILLAVQSTPELTSQENAVKFMTPLIWYSLACAVVMVPVTYLLRRASVATLGEVLFALPTRRLEISERPFFKSFWGLHLCLTFLLTLATALIVTEFSLYELTDPGGIQGAIRLYQGLTHANFGILPMALTQIVETVFIAFLATVIALPFAFLFSFLGAKNIMTGYWAFPVYLVIRTFLNLARSVEPLIWALIFTVWVGVGPFAGMLALMIHSVASLAKQYSEIVEDVNAGPIEAIRATGAKPVQVIWFAIVPQIVLPYIAFTIYRWDTNVRMATVIGLVGGGGIGNLLIRYQGQAMWPEVGCIIIVIAAAVWLMDIASAYVREALR